MDHLRKFHDVFMFPQNNTNDGHSDGSITLHPSLRSPENRTAAVGDVIKVLGEELVPGIRNEVLLGITKFLCDQSSLFQWIVNVNNYIRP